MVRLVSAMFVQDHLAAVAGRMACSWRQREVAIKGVIKG